MKFEKCPTCNRDMVFEGWTVNDTNHLVYKIYRCPKHGEFLLNALICDMTEKPKPQIQREASRDVDEKNRIGV